MGYAMEYVIKPMKDKNIQDHFRLNEYGMKVYREIMTALGMVYLSHSEMRWPNPEPYKNDEEKQELFDEFLDGNENVPDEIVERGDEYIETMEAVRVHHPAGGVTIPSHKLSTNKGWVVVPEEIEAALLAYESVEDDELESVLSTVFDTDERRAYWEKWITFLDVAFWHGGFCVY